MAAEHEMFEQIGDLGELAAYHEKMADGAAPRVETLHDIFVLVDRQTYQSLLAQ